MPPVRWKTAATAAVLIICVGHISATAREAKELIDDGWKPIIGHGSLRESHFSNENIHYRPEEVHSFPKENIQHRPELKKTDGDRNHNQKTTEKSPKKPMTSSQPHVLLHHNGQYHKNKMPHNAKHHQVHYVTNQGFTQAKPMLTHRSQSKIPKYPVMGKPHVAPSMNGKRVAKPPRGPVGAYSQRDEVLAPAPSTGLGNFAYFTHNNPTRLQHPNLDYVNNFGQQNDLFQFQRLPVQQYVLPKPQNEIPYTFQAQNDEYTRNLVPPPPSKEYIEKEKQKTKQIPKKEPTTETPKVTKPQNDLLLQLQSPYQQNPFYIIQNQNEQAIDVQLTKENVKELQQNIPIHFSTQDNYYQFKKPSQAPSRPTYEVTESKDWQDTPSYEQFQFQHAVKNEKRRPQKQEIFLPTPVKPLNPIPTLPTQNEVSTIFAELSQKINKQKQQLDPTFFNIKEVSTHYPIIGRPVPNHFEFSFTNDQENEITTLRPKLNKYVVEEVVTEPPITTTPIPVTKNWEQKRRPNPSRRRRPYRTKPTTEEVVQEEIETTTFARPQRRRPAYQRTTEATVTTPENTRSRYRQRTRPTQETMIEEVIETQRPIMEYAQKTRGSSYKQTSDGIRINNEEMETRLEEVESTEEQPASDEEMMDAIENIEYNTKKYEVTDEPTTTDSASQEEDFTTKSTPEITIKEVWETETEREDTTLATTTTSTTTTSTTPEPTTSKIIRRRPIQYQERPRFSVKKYKQRLNQYIASTTESTRITEQTTRSRSSYRSRRPLINKQAEEPRDETTEIVRKKFIPKDPRHGAASETKEEEVRPSRKPGRYRSTTQAPTTQKISIKPNIFNNLRRPPHASLRDRIISKNRTAPIEKTTEQAIITEESEESIENEESEPTEIIIENVVSSTDAPRVSTTSRTTTTTEIEDEEVQEVDILKNDAVLQSQRVSDLTSSAQNEYNTPGMFKSVSSNVRRVPSYFTIATEDPILPIEAFFTNINREKNKK